MRESRQLVKEKSVKDDEFYMLYDFWDGCTTTSRVRYGYDAEGRIASFAATNAANRGFQVEYLNEAGYNYGYTLTTPNGATLTRTVTRDPYRRSLTLDCTTRFNNIPVASFAYSFDAHSRPVARNNDRFAYNDRDEILSSVIGTNTISHAYDTIGNHVFCAFNSATNFYANNQLNQTTASYLCAPTSASDDATPQDAVTPPLFDGYDILSTNKFTWSAQGGLLRDGRFIYAFDAEDQLVSVTSATLTNGAIRVLNAYDYRHRRISKTVYTMRDDSPPPSPLAPPLPISHRTWCLQKRHDFVYDDWNLIHETVTTVDANSSTNVAEIEYFWGPDLSNTLQGAGGVGGLLAVSQNGQFYFPVYDNLGNIVKYLDENGNIVASYTYDDFGRTLSATGHLVSYFAFLFSTKYLDSETDLYYYGYRFYSPFLCSWINCDPIEEEGGVNLYSFCGNNACGSIDSDGRKVRFYQTGRTIVGTLNITIYYAHELESRAGTDLARIARRIKKSIENEWNAQRWTNGCCRVRFVAKVNYKCQVGSRGLVDDNLIAISTDSKLRSYVNGVGGSTGYWIADNIPGSDWRYAHEAGHLMGLDDDYVDNPVSKLSEAKVGHENHMMGAWRKPVAKHEVDDVLRINNVRCKTGNRR